MEILIWSTVLIPGPFYSIWRRTGVQTSCPHCNLPTLVKMNSDRGQIARRKFDLQLGLIPDQPPKLPEAEDVNAFGRNQQAEQVRPLRTKPIDPDQW